jgi:ABC-type antimicrobial peptide transport system permease subunit
VHGDIASLVLRHGIRVLVLGAALGAAGAFVASRFVRGLLFDVAPGDPPTFLLALGVLATAVLAGCLVPQIRATRIDPAVALRYE